MLCPICKGKRESLCFVDGRNLDTGRAFGEVRMVLCGACDGIGNVDDRYPNWQARGTAIREWRLRRGIGMREAIQCTGLGPAAYSRMERGLEDPMALEAAWKEVEAKGDDR